MVPSPSRSPVSVRQKVPRRRSAGGFLRRWTIPIVGGITPVGLIVINVAVYINDHLDQERWGIAIAAFLSGMMLNTWTGLNLYRWLQRRWPNWSPMHEQHQELLLVASMGVITIISFLSAYYCFVGLGDTKSLPNAQTFLYGAIQIAIAFLMKWYNDFDKSRQDSRARTSAGPTGAMPALTQYRGQFSGPLVPPDRTDAATRGRSGPPRSSTTTGGYVPPGYLPPS